MLDDSPHALHGQRRSPAQDAADPGVRDLPVQRSVLVRLRRCSVVSEERGRNREAGSLKLVVCVCTPCCAAAFVCVCVLRVCALGVLRVCAVLRACVCACCCSCCQGLGVGWDHRALPRSLERRVAPHEVLGQADIHLDHKPALARTSVRGVSRSREPNLGLAWQPSARVLSLCCTPLHVPAETPANRRGGRSSMAVSPTAACLVWGE